MPACRGAKRVTYLGYAPLFAPCSRPKLLRHLTHLFPDEPLTIYCAGVYRAFPRTRGAPKEIEGELAAASMAMPNAAFAAGQRVFHQKFGYGTVSEIEGNKLTVEFEKAGQKKVVASFVEAV